MSGRKFGGFAALAWPVKYGDNGVMTFTELTGKARVQSEVRLTAGARWLAVAGGIRAFGAGQMGGGKVNEHG